MKQDPPIIATKPFWSGDPNIEASGVRFMCPFCFQWILREMFEEHSAAHNEISKPE